jgi:hypothetical protein
MDLTLIQEAFDRVSKKQKIGYTKTQDVIDKTLHELQVAVQQMSDISDSSSTNDQRPLLIGLQGKLTEFGPSNQVHTFSLHTLSYLPRSLTLRLLSMELQSWYMLIRQEEEWVERRKYY